MNKYSYCGVACFFFISAAMLHGCAKTLPKNSEEVTPQSIAKTQAETEIKNRYEGSSSLKIEMRVLNEAYKNLIECLILKMPEGIEDPFREVKKARIYTEEALDRGQIYLPMENDKIMQFEGLYKQFYKKLDVLIEASRKKDVETLRELTPQLLNDCIQCHDRFRS